MYLITTAHRKKFVVVSVREIKELAAGFVLENRVRMMVIVVPANIVVLMPHAFQNVLSNCAPVVIIVERVNSAVVMLLFIYANVRNHALIYRAHITVSVHRAKIVVLTNSAP